MQKRTRYIILFGGFFIFFVLAPLLIFYVGGFSYDLGSNRYVPTGILAVQTDPAGAEIFLDNKLTDTSPKNVRFLKPREYQVSLRKDGYSSWEKRLPIWENKVTWSAGNSKKVYLLLGHPLSISLNKDVADFEIAGPEVYYLTGKSLVINNATNQAGKQTIPLPKPVKKLSVSPDKNSFLLQGDSTSLVYSLTTEKFTDLSIFLKNFTSLQFSPDGNLLGLSGNTLYKIALDNKQKIQLASDVLSFNVFKQNLYFLKRDGSKSALFSASALGQIANNAQLILGRLPTFKQSVILVTGDKEVFVIGDGTLYRITDKLESIAQNLSNYWLNPTDNILTFSLAGELYYFGNGEKNLVTRSSSKITNAVLRPEIGYSFFTQSDQIIALELDTRDQQNRYSLTDASNVSKMVLDDKSKTLYYLAGNELKFLNIR